MSLIWFKARLPAEVAAPAAGMPARADTPPVAREAGQMSTAPAQDADKALQFNKTSPAVVSMPALRLCDGS